MSFIRPLVVLNFIWLSACATTVTVTSDIPAPLVPKLSVQAEMIYTDEFKRYNYEEEEKGRGLRSIDFGEAQVALFDNIFGGLLNIVQPGISGQLVDMRITPSLLEFQYSAPRETRQKVYEIWLKYRLQITDNNNQEVADWVVKGYGKTPTALLTSADSAFNAATNIALRDVGAQLAIGFNTQPEIEEFLNTRLSTSISQSSIDNIQLEEPE
ncbi:MAG: hypothetical protein KTR16_12215 [Acidiferrobacterales bacterium]|nr:hypothetical protein [Acidiferrobacterales bacterium]